MKFTKMHGCGNDYIYVNGFEEQVEKTEQLIQELSDRNYGIGGDGVIFINPSKIADFEMEMYNADGSRGEMCGNGIRCVAKYVYDHQMTDQTEFTIESCGKVKMAELFLKEGKVEKVRINMGIPELNAKEIPVEFSLQSAKETVVNEPIEMDGSTYHITCVSMGNPHAVIFVDSVEALDLRVLGPKFEHHPVFPKRVNTEFVEVINETYVKMRVWERGSGETLACGTGCSATGVACVLNGLTKRKIQVEVLGGVIEIEWKEDTDEIYMTGLATEVFSGEVEV
ncbi:MAG: diaminopimelate epimerase [Eubacteriales bacterium]